MIKISYENGNCNMVDSNNKMLGYEFRPECCEYYGWIASENFEHENFTGKLIDINDIDLDTIDGYRS